jgi:hypothetical protein
MNPTEEQQRAIELFKTMDSLAIEAGAGTGKTSTLVMLAERAGSLRGQYIAFNKALVEESKAKFPYPQVRCNTAHSLAYGAVGHKYAHRLRSSERMRGADMASKLGIGFAEVMTFEGKPKTLYPGFLASQAQKTVTNFCQSGAATIELRHVPHMKGIEPLTEAAVRLALLDPARLLWMDLNQTFGWVPFKHEHYLKMWQLDDPKINTDFILFDEAQDANPVIAAIVANQDHAQLVYVGDSQQEIYAWTGAINALATVEVKNRTFLTQSFRFGQAIAERANEVLNLLEADIRLTGNPSITSLLEYLDTPRAILTRTNATGVSRLLAYQDKGVKAHLIGGAQDTAGFARAAQELQLTGKTFHPELVCFDSWASVQEYVRIDEGGEDLRLLVKLIDNFGAEKIIFALEHMPAEPFAEVVISTAHKSKGREWRTVQLAEDFPQQADSDKASLRLLYVSVTRAKEVLDDTALVQGGSPTIDPTEANVAPPPLVN